MEENKVKWGDLVFGREIFDEKDRFVFYIIIQEKKII